jgi:tetratricopeptide (TPR) repeat protein
VLTGGPHDLPARQRTLRDTIAWSHDLLSPEEQTLFQRLSVFVGGATLEAVEAVTNPDGALDVFALLAALVDHSLLRQADGLDGEPRFVMLETIREFGLERLGEGDDGAIRQRHAHYFLAFAERLRPQIDSREGKTVLARLEADHANLRAALTWAIEREDADLGVRLGAALWKFWYVRGNQDEASSWLEHVLALPGASPPGTRSDALYGAGWFAHFAGKEALAEAHGEEALALARQAADPLRAAMALALIGGLAHDRGDLVSARQLNEEALASARESGHPHFIAMYAQGLGGVVIDQGDLDRAAALFEEALTLWRERGESWAVGIALLNVGKAARARSDFPRGAATYREALAFFVDHGDRVKVASCLEGLAYLAALDGGSERAARLLGAAEALYQSAGAGTQLPIHDRTGHGPALAAMHAALDDGAIAAAWASGRALSFEQALVEARDVADALAGN